MGKYQRWYKLQRVLERIKNWFVKGRAETDRMQKTHKKVHNKRRGSVDGFLNEVVARKQAGYRF